MNRRAEAENAGELPLNTDPKRRLPLGNPAEAPSVILKWWRSGRLGRAAVTAYGSAVILGLGLGILIGMVTDPHWTDKSSLRWAIFGLLGVGIFCLILLGGFLLYLAGRREHVKGGAKVVN